MRTADFDFHLPPELIAQTPAAERDESRLLVVHRPTGQTEHRRFRDILQYLKAGDVLVLNNSRVIPARLRGVNAQSGGAFEMLLLEENGVNDWWAMMKPGKRARVGTAVEIKNQKSESKNSILATVLEVNGEGHRRLSFSGVPNIADVLDEIGEIPLPPYIAREEQRAEDRERYQTVYAQPAGSVAAPTAGLHFTEALLDEVRSRGVQVCFVTLHVGLGTFAPVKAETLAEHQMHVERFEVSEGTAQAVNAAKREGRRVIAVGTTSVRVLESAAEAGDQSNIEHRTSNAQNPTIRIGAGRTRIFIYPPRSFQVVDALLTNFHLPCSTLLMLVSAFAAPGEMRGREIALAAYAEAVRERYRFFSYGDAMLLI